ncbi:hypothetical protein D3C81_2239370 [compost metagenome]
MPCRAIALWASMVFEVWGSRDGVSMPISRTPRLASKSTVALATAVKSLSQVASGAWR